MLIIEKLNNGAAGAFGHVPEVRSVPLANLKPSPENDRLYRPVTMDDPDVQALAVSIRQHGIQEPLLVTPAYYIVSGHRRFAAARLAGLASVPCRMVDYERGDPQFLVMLRECNRQRVKSTDEVLREELVSAMADPKEARRRLVQHRRQRSRVNVEAVEISDAVKRRSKITDVKRSLLDAVFKVLDDLKEFAPVTLRQIHYQLLNYRPLKNTSDPDSEYRNDKQSYKNLSDLLIRARLEGLIDWDLIDDPTRPVVVWDSHRGVGPYIRKQLDGFLKNYFRDLQQSQPTHIEIVGEKNTIQGVIAPVAAEYCIPYTLGRGYCSGSPRRKMQERFRVSGKDKLMLLFLSDFDPEGEDIVHSFAWSLRDEFGAQDVTAVKVALTKAQVREMNLPPVMTAKDGSRRDGFVEKNGENVWELEAVPPVRLQQLLRAAVDGVLDLDLFEAEQEEEAAEYARLEVYRQRFNDLVVQGGMTLDGA